MGAMPNTNPAIHDEQTFLLAEEKAKKAHCDFALFLGATPHNAKAISSLAPRAAGTYSYDPNNSTCALTCV